MLQVRDPTIVPGMRSGRPRIVIMTAGILIGLFGGSIRALFRARGREHLR
jgi:uncharacterized protein involved in exopolysaccharide biosynthesis